jgi:serine protease DegQ
MQAQSARTRPPVRTALLAAFAAVVLAACGDTTTTTTTTATATATGTTTGTTSAGSSAAAPAPPPNIPAMVQQAEPSVVTVLAGSGQGSGIVYRADGVVVTNAHVVGDARQVSIGFADGQQVPGTVRAADRVSDVAVVEAARRELPAARFQQELPQVGEVAVAIGSPLGFEATVTSGIISGLHRQIPGSATNGAPLVDLVQTDAPISPGNSGGALLDGQGDVVGMNVAYIPPEAGAVSLGYAIPAATVVEVAEQLLTSGRASHAYIGIQPATLTPQVATKLGVSRGSGVLVLHVATPSPAADAGIAPGDVIVALGEQQTPTAEKFVAALRAKRPGERIELTVLRGDETRKMTVVVADRPAE